MLCSALAQTAPVLHPVECHSQSPRPTSTTRPRQFGNWKVIGRRTPSTTDAVKDHTARTQTNCEHYTCSPLHTHDPQIARHRVAFGPPPGKWGTGLVRPLARGLGPSPPQRRTTPPFACGAVDPPRPPPVPTATPPFRARRSGGGGDGQEGVWGVPRPVGPHGRCRCLGPPTPPPPSAPPRRNAGYGTCAQAADKTKRRKCGSSVAYKTIGTFLSKVKAKMPVGSSLSKQRQWARSGTP